MLEATNGLSFSHSSQDQQYDYELDSLELVKAHAEEEVDIVEEVDRYQNEERSNKRRKPSSPLVSY